jgi:hypothetical protein
MFQGLFIFFPPGEVGVWGNLLIVPEVIVDIITKNIEIVKYTINNFNKNINNVNIK